MLVEFLSDPYLALEVLDWIVGWNIAALRLGCNVLSYVIICISLVTLIQIAFHKRCCVDDVYSFIP